MSLKYFYTPQLSHLQYVSPAKKMLVYLFVHVPFCTYMYGIFLK